MKHIIAIILVAVLGLFIFSSLYSSNDSGLAFKGFGDVDLKERVSDSYINKNVNGDKGEVIFGESKNLESGSANIVTSIVVNYRSFDTLGEITVLFVSALGVGLILSGKRKRSKFSTEPNFILKHGARIVFGIMIVFGVYMFIHGHLTPGGGFPGGSIIAAAMLLLYMADNEFRAKLQSLKVAEGTAGSMYVIIGLLGLVLGGYFLYNFLPTGTVGSLFSASIIPIVYILIGLKVGSEITGIIDHFTTEEVEG